MAKSIISYSKSLYFYLRQTQIRIREKLFAKVPQDLKATPIIINNFNRLTFLQTLIKRLEECGYTNIYIIDNASTYPPLLDFYETIPYKVFRLKENIGYLSLWKTGICKKFRNQYFVYTDSDVVPCDDCPNDFIEYFYQLMKKYPRASKVGFALKIDDLPNTFKNKDKVLSWERKFWENTLEPNIYKAAIDTTFALYRPNIKGGAYFHDFMIRTAGKYQAKHLPWYNDDNNPTDEELYYISYAKTSTHWTILNK